METIKMSKSKMALLTVVLVTLLSFSAVWTINAKENDQNKIDTKEQEEIKNVIEAYFEARYQSFSTLQLEDFGALAADTESGNEFMQSESEKLSIELYHTEVFNLRYIQAEFFLEFKDVVVDSGTQNATVVVLEGHDVIHEITPSTVSSMANLEHTISLSKINGSWMIINDDYSDLWWNALKDTDLTKEEILDSIDESHRIIEETENNTSDGEQLQILSGETYDRNGARVYAAYWWNRRNLKKYDDFSTPWGDCTNFVSQAMHDGGKLSLNFPDGDLGIGTAGWYYVDMNHRAAPWTHVDYIYQFIITPHSDGGPVGYEVSSYSQTAKGDIIQYERSGSTSEWEHAVIIVGYNSNGIPLIASHSDDYWNKPYTIISFRDVRYIHVQGATGGIDHLPVLFSER